MCGFRQFLLSMGRKKDKNKFKQNFEARNMLIIIKKIIRYFDLKIDRHPLFKTDQHSNRYRSTHATKRISKRSKSDIFWLLGMYIATVSGAFCKFLFDILTKENPAIQFSFFIQKSVLSLIIAILIFPLIYKNAHLDPNNPGFVQLCISFQNGFFWQTVLGGMDIG